jgi:hypothetical protein
MRCHEFEKRLNDVLDRRLAPEEDRKLRGHARRCGQCAEMLEAYRTLTVGLSRMNAPEPEAGFSFRVLHSVSSGGAARAVAERRKRRVIWYAGGFAAAAASLFIAAAIWRGPGASQSRLMPTRMIATVDYAGIARQTGRFASSFAGPQIVLVGELAQRFEPVRDSFYAALDALRRTWPVEERNRT